MTTYIALLRGINVGGNKMVAMSDLRELLTQLRFVNPRSLLQSGNLVFEHDGPGGAALERLLETETHKRLGLQTDFVVRSAKQWTSVVADNPFTREASHDPARLVVVFLKDAPKPKGVAALQAAITGRETVRVAGKQAYIVYPDGQGTSRLNSAVIDRHLGTRGTARNWNTVRKLAAIAG